MAKLTGTFLLTLTCEHTTKTSKMVDSLNYDEVTLVAAQSTVLVKPLYKRKTIYSGGTALYLIADKILSNNLHASKTHN
jgi:hypothetical protein